MYSRLFLKDDCPFCEPMLNEMLNLLQLTHQYYLSLKFDCTEGMDKENLTVAKKKLYAFSTRFDAEFEVSLKAQGVIIFSGSLAGIDQKQDLVGLANFALCNNTNITKFPSVFLEGKKIHEMYDGGRLKRHLVLEQYR